MCDYALFVYTPYYPSVGHCIVYFSLGLSTTSILIDESISTLSFYILIHRKGDDAEIIFTTMKRLFIYSFLVAGLLFTSCFPTQTIVTRTYDYQESSARNLEGSHAMMVTPLVADVDVRKDKIVYVEREAFADVEVTQVVINNISEFKKIALSRAAKAHNADVMVGTIIDVTTENGRLVITVSGYPAVYKSFRNATANDIELSRDAQSVYNNLGADIISNPDQTMNILVKK